MVIQRICLKCHLPIKKLKVKRDTVCQCVSFVKKEPTQNTASDTSPENQSPKEASTTTSGKLPAKNL